MITTLIAHANIPRGKKKTKYLEQTGLATGTTVEQKFLFGTRGQKNLQIEQLSAGIEGYSRWCCCYCGNSIVKGHPLSIRATVLESSRGELNVVPREPGSGKTLPWPLRISIP